MVYPSLKYQGPSSFYFRVNEVLRADGPTEGRTVRCKPIFSLKLFNVGSIMSVSRRGECSRRDVPWNNTYLLSKIATRYLDVEINNP